ncbi:glutaredoxin 3 [Ancylobacter dichloromethanicus]|uniref:Glutaredoxin n=1 Tax=Ancylobacter dichloromethanicus TaxID=518825 RepID=A0A9W6MYB2_9HYPH|nr:glutaredoxin 3 [Ancylobacter dichloromethanicus]MBS7555563.1 glutaredoxin 3 [Ancylobacter dichloromethanicus]GLK70765.1 glutaredoxin 3 [Ancylobacter dichloromethanicus]
MAKIEIYTTYTCPYCHAAKSLLARKGAGFSEVNVTGDPVARSSMSSRANGRTSVPQIFIDGRHVGGCDDLYALEEAGELDALLAS